MSRLAKKPVIIPSGVTLTASADLLLVKGPKGELKVPFLSGVSADAKDGQFTVSAKDNMHQSKINIGTFWALVRNAIEGVTDGFTRILEIEGVGYKAAVEGQELVLSLGYVLPVRFKIPAGLTVKVEKNTIIMTGIDKELITKAASQIRKLKEPEPYKGKGIRYQGETIRRKVGKKAAAAAS
jgi:large subunit ribosomal protein L6